MSEPKRWVDGGGPEGADELLRAAAPIRDLTAEEDARMRRRVARIAGLPAFVVALWLSAKGIAAAAAVIVILAGAVAVWSVRGDDADAPTPTTPVAHEHPAVPAREPIDESPLIDGGSAPDVHVAEPDAHITDITDVEPPRVSPHHTPRQPSFSAEVALIEAARRDAADRPRAALAILRRYDREYPDGQLQLESEAIRIEALAHAGRTREARRLADRFLREHPQAPYVDRIRRIADAP